MFSHVDNSNTHVCSDQASESSKRIATNVLFFARFWQQQSVCNCFWCFQHRFVYSFYIWLSFIEIPPIPSQVVVLISRWYLAKVRIALGCGGCEREHLQGKHRNPCHASVHTQRSDYLGKPHICGREGHETFYIWTLFFANWVCIGIISQKRPI